MNSKAKQALMNHTLSNWQEQGTGEALHLVDLLSIDDGRGIASGEHEIDLILDSVYVSVQEDVAKRSVELIELRSLASRLSRFAKMVIDNAFQGCDTDGATAQELAVKLGLLQETQFDPLKHDSSEIVETGEPWFVFSDDVQRHIQGYKNLVNRKHRAFIAHFCDSCKKQQGCDIIPKMIRYSVEDDEYPEEWVRGAEGSCCTAFEDKVSEAEKREKRDRLFKEHRFWFLSTTPQKGLHNAKWMKRLGKEPVLYYAVDMDVEFCFVGVCERGCERYMRQDPHWAIHEFKPITIEGLEQLLEDQKTQFPRTIKDLTEAENAGKPFSDGDAFEYHEIKDLTMESADE